MKEFSHVGEDGRPRMVDVSAKRDQLRTARASGFIRMAESTVAAIAASQVPKGNVLTVAEIAGVQAAKRTGTLIPLCHPLTLTNVRVTACLETGGVNVSSEVTCIGRTGVEMEALTAVSAALLTVYDMCKAVDKEMTIGEIRLVEKTKQDLT